MTEQTPQVRMRDGAASQPQSGEQEDNVPAPFPSEPQPGQRYEIEANGVRVGIRWWNALDRLRFFEMIGGANAINPGVLSITIPAFLISDVGEKAYKNRPSSREGLEKKIEAVGDAAIFSAWGAMSPVFAPQSDEDQEAGETALKKE